MQQSSPGRVVDDQCVGRGAVSTGNGNLFQLAVEQKYRWQSIGSNAIARTEKSHSK